MKVSVQRVADGRSDVLVTVNGDRATLWVSPVATPAQIEYLQRCAELGFLGPTLGNQSTSDVLMVGRSVTALAQITT